jgi:hypothetical protein
LNYVISIGLGALSVALLLVGCGCLLFPRRMIDSGFVWLAPKVPFAMLQGVFVILLSFGAFDMARGAWPLS